MSDDHVQHVASAAVRLTIEQHGLQRVREDLGDRPSADQDDQASVEAWLAGRRAATERHLATVGSIRSSATPCLSALVVAAHEWSSIVGLFASLEGKPGVAGSTA
jgi:hypothetical protein